MVNAHIQRRNGRKASQRTENRQAAGRISEAEHHARKEELSSRVTSKKVLCRQMHPSFAIGVNVATPRPDPNAFAAQLVAALNAQGSTVSVVALYNATTGQVRLTTLSGDAVPDKDYELWAIEGSNAPKSMGVIPINQRVDVKVAPDILAGFGPGTTLAITLESKGGSKTGAPQGPVVAAGQATPI